MDQGWVVRLPPRSGWLEHGRPSLLIRLIQHHGFVLRQLIRRDVLARYRGTILGPVWSLASPLCALTIYSLVFGAVMRVQWPGYPVATGLDFALVLFSGLVVFNFFNEVACRAPVLLVHQPQLVKKVVFPFELLPLSAVGAAFVQMLVGTGVLVFLLLVRGTGWHWGWFLWPLAVPALLAFAAGTAWFLATLGTIYRDLVPAVAALCQLTVFLTPILYPLAQVPSGYRPLFWLNPLTWFVELFRGAAFGITDLDWSILAGAYALGLAALLVGYATFMRTKATLADVV